MKNILCFGDCNTFGKGEKEERFPRDIRWTGKAQKILGDKYYLIEEGLAGRTTVFQDPLLPHRCGLDALPISLQTHRPLDLVILSLGTNDIKRYFKASVEDIAAGMEKLVQTIQMTPALGTDNGLAKILIFSPVALGEKVSRSRSLEYDEISRKKSMELGAEYYKVAQRKNCFFLDCSTITPVGNDQLHIDSEGHLAVADVIAEKIKEILG